MTLSTTGRRRLVLLAAVVACLVTARLGVWQLDRAESKLALQAAIQTAAEGPPLSQAELARDEDGLSRQLHRQITLKGEWLDSATVYLDNRQMRGRPGFFVVTPLRLASGDAVLVQRGWLPRDAQDRSRVPAFTKQVGVVTVLARIEAAPSRLASLGQEAPGPIQQNIDVEEQSRALGLTLRPLSVQQLVAPGDQPDGLLRDWPQVSVDVHKHYGYAAQWFVFCAMIAGLYVWFQLLRPRRVRTS